MNPRGRPREPDVTSADLELCARVVEGVTGVSTDRILGTGRRKDEYRARQALYWALHAVGYNFSAIGRAVGRHPSTVLMGQLTADSDDSLRYKLRERMK